MPLISKDQLDNPDQVSVIGDKLSIDLWYVRCDGTKIKAVEVGICDVRAANSIVVDYDFDRDGYRIRMLKYPQEERVVKEEGDFVQVECVDELVEVAFIPAWAAGSPKEP